MTNCANFVDFIKCGVQSGGQSGVRSDIDGGFAVLDGEAAWGYKEFGEIKVVIHL